MLSSARDNENKRLKRTATKTKARKGTKRWCKLCFHCLNYTSLLLPLIVTHLVNTWYNNYVTNMCPRQLLWFI